MKGIESKRIGSRSKLYMAISKIMVMAIIFSVFPVTGLNAKAADKSEYWTNYASTPNNDGGTYIIKNAAELAWVAVQVNNNMNNLAGCTIKLGGNIDLSGHFWEPIGNNLMTFLDDGTYYISAFAGNFDGNGCKISNLTIGTSHDPEPGDRIGLFGKAVNPAVIKNIYLENVSIISTCAFTGSLVGETEGAIVTNCNVSGNVNCADAGGGCIGGLIGCSGGIMANCSSSCNVTGGSYAQVGGLAGVTAAINCCATGSVTGGDGSTIGGLAGAGVFNNCFATGNVKCGNSESHAGGLAGITSNMINCYATGDVTCGDYSYVGGLSGGAYDGSMICNDYWNADADQVINGQSRDAASKVNIGDFMRSDVDTGVSNIDSSVSKTSASMKTDEFVALLNNYVKTHKAENDIDMLPWKLVPDLNNGYPVLIGVMTAGESSVPAEPEQPGTETPAQDLGDKIAVPTAASVQIDGKDVAFTAYNIDGSNYFKLRDLAMALNNTDKQFQVGWDDGNKAVTITVGEVYTAVGGELSVSGNTESKTAVRSTSKIYYYGSQIDITAYMIDGNNYFKLRDVAQVIDFGVNYDSTAKAIIIDTTLGYIS